MATYFLQVAFWLTLVLGGLALGATTPEVGGLVLSQSLRPVGLGLVAGCGLAAALGIVLMSTPAAEQIGAIVHVFDPVAYAASLLLILVPCAPAALIPAVRAARIEPIKSLRQD